MFAIEFIMQFDDTEWIINVCTNCEICMQIDGRTMKQHAHPQRALNVARLICKLKKKIRFATLHSVHADYMDIVMVETLCR